VLLKVRKYLSNSLRAFYHTPRTISRDPEIEWIRLNWGSCKMIPEAIMKYD
jgi:hypothetical protein